MEMFEMKGMQEALDVTVEESWTMYNIVTFRPNTGVLLNGACARIPTRTLTAEQGLESRSAGRHRRHIQLDGRGFKVGCALHGVSPFDSIVRSGRTQEVRQSSRSQPLRYTEVRAAQGAGRAG